jgi:hypothetical protein
LKASQNPGSGVVVREQRTDSAPSCEVRFKIWIARSLDVVNGGVMPVMPLLVIAEGKLRPAGIRHLEGGACTPLQTRHEPPLSPTFTRFLV